MSSEQWLAVYPLWLGRATSVQLYKTLWLVENIRLPILVPPRNEEE